MVTPATVMQVFGVHVRFPPEIFITDDDGQFYPKDVAKASVYKYLKLICRLQNMQSFLGVFGRREAP